MLEIERQKLEKEKQAIQDKIDEIKLNDTLDIATLKQLIKQRELIQFKLDF
jgi:hypothetical protein